MYYDGTKLLSQVDLNGNKPEIYISTDIRSAGKTTYFNKMLLNRFIKCNKQFVLLYRYNYELSGVADRFFNSINTLFFPKDKMTDKSIGHNMFKMLLFNEKICGYAVAINSAENVKKMSHLFENVTSILFDEFQSETGCYAQNEIQKFISIHTSIARGGGKQSRYVPVYLVSNLISQINPYYTALHIPQITSKSKFIKGNGWVLENSYTQTAAKAHEESIFNRAFMQNDYVQALINAKYLNDSYSFIEKINEDSTIICGLKFKGEYYQFRYVYGSDKYYLCEGFDKTYKDNYAVMPDEHDSGTILKIGTNNYSQLMSVAYSQGKVVFSSLKAKECGKAFMSL